MNDINHLLDDVERNQDKHQRFYLGISQIGNPNQRLLWMRWRWLMPDDMEPRVLRLLDLGNVVEDHLIAKLRQIPNAGIFDVDERGRQFETKALGGHVKGHIDGVARNLPGLDKKYPYLLEFKTANDNRFKNLKDLGSYCEWSEEYAAQVHLYMGLFNFKHCIAIVYNKNNSDLYTEIIEFDKIAFDSLMEKAENILLAEAPPDNYIPETDYRIRSFMSPAQQSAYLGRTLPENIHCRSCRFAKVDLEKSNGAWYCTKHEKHIPEKRQTMGCKNHNYIPELIDAHVMEVDDDKVLYQKNDVQFYNVEENSNCRGKNYYSSKELIEVFNTGDPIGFIKAIDGIKNKFDGTVEKVEKQ